MGRGQARTFAEAGESSIDEQLLQEQKPRTRAHTHTHPPPRKSTHPTHVPLYVGLSLQVMWLPKAVSPMG